MYIRKIGKYWSDDLPEFDAVSKNAMELAIKSIAEFSEWEYVMSPTSDIFKITFKQEEFILLMDLDHDCYLKCINKECLLSNKDEIVKLVKEKLFSKVVDEICK